MGIQSTRDITRETAMSRISEIDALVAERDYRGLEGATSEPDYDIRKFMDSATVVGDVSKWTDRMLEDQMDAPFYRFSMFDNYSIRQAPS